MFSRETTSVTLQADMAGAKNISSTSFRSRDSADRARRQRARILPIGSTTVLPTADVIDVVNPGGSSSLTEFDDLDFRADVDSDEDTDRVCYRLVSGQLRRRVIEDPAARLLGGTEELLAQNVAGFAVQILDARGTC